MCHSHKLGVHGKRLTSPPTGCVHKAIDFLLILCAQLSREKGDWKEKEKSKERMSVEQFVYPPLI
jgi:hypothetical protein